MESVLGFIKASDSGSFSTLGRKAVPTTNPTQQQQLRSRAEQYVRGTAADAQSQPGTLMGQAWMGLGSPSRG